MMTEAINAPLSFAAVRFGSYGNNVDVFRQICRTLSQKAHVSVSFKICGKYADIISRANVLRAVLNLIFLFRQFILRRYRSREA